MSILTVTALFESLDELLSGTTCGLALFPQLRTKGIISHSIGIQAWLVV